MIQYITGRNEETCAWVAHRLGLAPEDLWPCTTIAIVRDNAVIAGIVFNNYRPKSRDIHLTVHAETASWLTRGVLRYVLGYVFKQLDCIRLTVTVAKKNKRARKLALGLGFTQEGNIRRGYDGFDDAIVYGMLSRECRWIGETSHGKKYASTA